jgi:hypothetical protein
MTSRESQVGGHEPGTAPRSFWERRIEAPIFSGVSVGGVVLTLAAILGLIVIPILLDNAYFMRIA